VAREAPTRAPAITIRPLARTDAEDVAAIDARHTGERKAGYWDGVLAGVVGGGEGAGGAAGGRLRVGLAACEGERLVGFVIGEVRAFEFGSEPCGWVLALGVAPARVRRGVASALLAEAAARFRAAGVRRVRTMVRRNDVPVLAFFRSNGFVGGPFVQLEMDLGPEGGGGVEGVVTVARLPRVSGDARGGAPRGDEPGGTMR
jgi:ribosomal protein S18 acetylase RimI-like enzyme